MFDFLKAKAKDASEAVTGLASSPGAPSSAADASPADGKYTVQPGDSLSKIANKYNVSLDQIIAANPQIKDPNVIHPREVINLG